MPAARQAKKRAKKAVEPAAQSTNLLAAPPEGFRPHVAGLAHGSACTPSKTAPPAPDPVPAPVLPSVPGLPRPEMAALAELVGVASVPDGLTGYSDSDSESESEPAPSMQFGVEVEPVDPPAANTATVTEAEDQDDGAVSAVNPQSDDEEPPPPLNDEEDQAAPPVPQIPAGPLTDVMIKAMNVDDLKHRLKARTCSHQGLKAELIARLVEFSAANPTFDEAKDGLQPFTALTPVADVVTF